MKRKIVTVPRLLSFAASVVVLALLLRQVDFAALGGLLFKAQPGLVLAGFAAYLLKSALRGARFAALLERPRPRFLAAMRLTLASSLAGQLLPFKLGELVFVYLVKREMKSSISQGISSLMILRVFDLLSTAVLFLLAVLALGLPGSFAEYEVAILVFTALMAAGLAAAALALRFLPWLEAKAPRLAQPTSAGRGKKLAAELVRQAFSLLAAFRAVGFAQLAGGFVLALLEWAVNFAVYHAMLYAIGLTPLLFDTVAAVTFAVLASVLPINSLGSFGTQEAGWATGLILLGYTQEAAITSGFAAHLLQLGYMLVLGGAAWISYLLPVNRMTQRGKTR